VRISRVLAVGISLLTASLLTVALAANAGAADTNYAALGDSYSSGVGAGDYSGGSCDRSAHAYAQQWADTHAPSSFSFLACSGATTTDVINGQVSALSLATTLVSITIGGNDAGFSSVMQTCVLGSTSDCVAAVNTAEDFVNASLYFEAKTFLHGLLLVEDKLNSQVPDPRYSRYEILNLSVAADSILQRVLRLEEEGFAFQPDAAILSITAVDEQFVASHLRKALIQGVEPSPGYREVVESVVRRSGVNSKMPAVMIERRLQPFYTELCRWSFQRFAQQCAQHGVRPLVIYRPAPADFSGQESAARSKMIELAHAAGLEVIDLSPAFDSVTDRSSLILAKWDDHTTALGHRLLADELHKDLVPLLFGSSGQQQTPFLQKP